MTVGPLATRPGIVLSSRELRLNHKAEHLGIALSANPPLSHEMPTPCRLSERSDAEGRHPCRRSARSGPTAAEDHLKRPAPT
jgi:hypothetical protein